MANSDTFSLYIHHGGKLFDCGGPFPFYGGGDITMKHGLDADKFGYFDLCEEVEKLGYVSFERLGYKVPGISEEVQYLSDDVGVIEMLQYTRRGNGMIIVYIDGGKKEQSCSKDRTKEGSEGDDGSEDDDGSEGDGGSDNDDSIEDVGIVDLDVELHNEDEEDDQEYFPAPESETDDGLDDDELASDDDEYIEARQNLTKFKNYVHVEDVVPPVELGTGFGSTEENVDTNVNVDTTGFVSEYEDSDAEMNSDSTFEEDTYGNEGCRKTKKKVRYDPRCDHKTFNFVLGMRFEDRRQCRAAIQKYAISQGLAVYFTRSSSSQVEAHCRGENCCWKLYGSMIKKYQTFAIKTYYGKHTCHRVVRNKIATSSWIAKEYLNKFRRNPNYSIQELMDDVLEKYSVELTKIKCYRAKWKALEMLRGSVHGHYAQLRPYIAELMRVDNRGRFETLLDDKGCLRGFFVGFSALTQGFLKGCRPIIGFDGCFLKTVLGGALLAAIGKDGNDKMYPICWAVVEAENEFFWSWFMEIVFQELNVGDGLGWTFISDQQKGLLNSIQKLTPYAEVRNCARHVYCNWKKEFKGQVLKNIFWGAVRSTYEAAYLANLEDMKSINEAAYLNFCERDPTKWCKSYVSTLPKCDMVDNNISETFNGYIVKSRSKHIIDMLEDIRCALMERQHTQLMEMSGVTDTICPRIRRKLEKNKYNSRLCIAKPAVGGKFQVCIGEDQFVVDLNNWMCTCRVWDMSGIPCIHACACIHFMKKDTVDFVDPYYSVARYIETYSIALEPINGRKMWPRAEGNPIKPPPYRKMPGRPKKMRKRAPEEDPKNPHRLSRHGVQMTCSTCGQIGHNKRSCPNKSLVQDSSTRAKKVPAKRGRPRARHTVQTQEHSTRNKASRTQVKGGKDSNQQSEMRQVRQGYGVRIFNSGNIYMRMPQNKKVKYVHGVNAAGKAAGKATQPTNAVGKTAGKTTQPTNAAESRASTSSAGLSYTRSTIASRVATRSASRASGTPNARGCRERRGGRIQSSQTSTTTDGTKNQC